MTLTFFRPQRRPVPEERCPPPNGPECTSTQWIDVGHMRYGAAITDVAQMGPRGACPQSAFTATDPAELTPTEPPGPFQSPGLTDQTDGRLASGDSFTYQLNLTECFAGTPWNSGEVASVSFTAHPQSQTLTDATLADIRFKLE